MPYLVARPHVGVLTPQNGQSQTQTTVGCNVEDVFPRVLVEYTRLDQKVREVFRTGQSVEGGKVAYRAPGLPTRIYYYRLIPLKLALSGAEKMVEGAEEAVENVLLLMDDITEREQLGEEVQRAERHLASVVECANDLVISMDSRGNILTWNRAAERISGLTAEEVKEWSLLSLCAAEQRPVMGDMLHQLACGKGVQNTEVNLLTANGDAVPIAWSCSPMRGDGGTVTGIVAVGRDLTERRQLEAQLIHSAKMASLGVMAGGIAHELLQQVFTNLILNACNAMPQGGTLTVATRATEADEASPRGSSSRFGFRILNFGFASRRRYTSQWG